MAVFAPVWEMIKKHEGTEFENVKYDAGGPTKFGITLANLPPGSTAQDIENLTEEQAMAIAIKQFWNPIKGDTLDQKWATILCDQSYERGVHGASNILASINHGQAQPQLAFDFLKACAAACVHHVTVDPTQAKFLAGWLNRINDLEAFLFDLHYAF